MSVRAAVVAVLRRYDDEAWIVLASRGMLRRARKDLANLPVRVLAEDEEAVTLAVGARQVTLTPAGPTQATCTCSATETCQHIIVAGLWLVAQDDAAAPVPVDVPAAPAAPAAAPAAVAAAPAAPAAALPTTAVVDPLHAELLAMTRDQLIAFAGLPAFRWAYAHVSDTPPEDVEVWTEPHICVALRREGIECRYLGGGLAGFLTEPKTLRWQRHVVAAVLAYQRAAGAPLPEPAPPPRGEAGDASLATRHRLLEASRRLLTDTLSVGVSHLSPAMFERYEALATWAQGAELYRLALLLRGIADDVELLLARSVRADEQRLFENAALAHALATALQAALDRGAAPSHLVGRARHRYDWVAELEVLGLGGWSWQSATGYHGLTALFWSPGEHRFLSWTDARPTSLGAFEPRARWTRAGPWPGTGSPSNTPGRRLILRDAERSEDGRLSGVDRTRATVQVLTGAELVELLPVADSWAVLAREHDPARRSLLAPPSPLAAWAVLQPAVFGPARFDLTRQTLLWPLRDATGATLLAEVPWTPHTVHAITRIEGLDPPLPGTLLVARLRADPSGLVASPLSLVLPVGAGREVVDCLHLDPPPRPVVSEIAAAMERRREPPAPAAAPPPPPAPLVDLRAWLRGRAERGVAGANPAALREELARHHRALRAAGLAVFGEPDPAAEAAELLLRSQFLLMQVTVALTGGD